MPTRSAQIIESGSDHIPAMENPRERRASWERRHPCLQASGNRRLTEASKHGCLRSQGGRRSRGIIIFGSDYIPATEVNAAIFYFVSRGSTALNISVFHSETEFLISALNFTPLSRGSASTIFSCCAALTRY